MQPGVRPRLLFLQIRPAFRIVEVFAVPKPHIHQAGESIPAFLLKGSSVARWLVKTEPGEYAFSRMLKDPVTRWDGIANNLALQHLRRMRTGDPVLVYHSGAERAVVGIAEVASLPYPDPAAGDSRLVVVDLKAKRALPRTVPLAAIKAEKGLKEFDLVRISRLSVMPVSDGQWEILLRLSKE